MDTTFETSPLMLDFLTSAYTGKKLYEKYCCEAYKKYGLTINEGDVLLHVYFQGGESRARDIVEQKWVSKSQVSKSVDKLTSMGYLTASVDENDRRLVNLRLTDEAENAVCDLRKATESFLKKMFDGIDIKEIRELNRVLAKMSENVRR